MYVYLITNLINNKKYVGITNNYKRRWYNEKLGYKASRPQVITNAIGKYGKENFKFELLYSGLSIQEAEEKEYELIKYYDCKVPHGYNVNDGGEYFPSNNPQYGEKNGKALLTDMEAQYIKDHRYIPEYVLYEEFNDKISYAAFKNIYNHKTYTHLVPGSDPYPYNFEFSCQFNDSKYEYDEILDIRKRFANGEYWKNVYQDYKDKNENEWSFWNLYYGNRFKLIMPEVFTEENKKKHSKLKNSGSNNGHAKLTKDDIIKIRKLYENECIPAKEIYKLYPQVTSATIRNIINYKTWNNLI